MRPRHVRHAPCNLKAQSNPGVHEAARPANGLERVTTPLRGDGQGPSVGRGRAVGVRPMRVHLAPLSVWMGVLAMGMGDGRAFVRSAVAESMDVARDCAAALDGYARAGSRLGRCEGGGQLVDSGKFHEQTSCSECACPLAGDGEALGFGGPYCATCRSAEACPSGSSAACSATHPLPLLTEKMVAKRLSCGCQEADSWMCSKPVGLPFLRFEINLTLNGGTAEDPAEMDMVAFAGVPSAGDEWIQSDKHEEYPGYLDYAVPDYFHGTFSGCVVRNTSGVQTCPRGSPYSDCFTLACEKAESWCPPSPPAPSAEDVEKYGEDNAKYWSLATQCPPQVAPFQGSAEFTCREVAEESTVDNGDPHILCWFTQVGGFGPLGLNCTTGACLAEDSPVVSFPRENKVHVLISPSGAYLVVLAIFSLGIFGLAIAASMLTTKSTGKSDMNVDEEDDSVDAMTVSLLASARDPDAPSTASDLPEPLAFERRTDLVFSNVSVHISASASWTHPFATPHNAVVLPPCYGTVRSGELWAVMGPQGSGKTVLLASLAGRPGGRFRVHGDVGVPECTSLSRSARRNVVGFVPSEDVLPPTLTVREYLNCQARMRLVPEREWPEERRARRVASVLSSLALDRAADTLIGGRGIRGVSGGERRRLCVATELICPCPVLILDEPTTGLDAGAALVLVHSLRDAAHRMGCAVLFSVHQPRREIFNAVDGLFLMAKSGKLVYSGPASAALTSLRAKGLVPEDRGKGKATAGSALPWSNPADILLDAVDDMDAEIVSEWTREDGIRRGTSSDGNDSEEVQRSEGEVVHRLGMRKANPMTELGVQLWRSSIHTARHPRLLQFNFSACVVTALVLGSVFSDLGKDTSGIRGRFGILFFIVLFLATLSLSTLPLWSEDTTLFAAERASGSTSTWSYFTSKVVCEMIPLRLLPPLVFLSSHAACGLNDYTGVGVLTFAATLVVANIAGASMCMAVGVLFSEDSGTAATVGTSLNLLFIFFTGFLVNARSIPHAVAFLREASWSNRALKALILNEFALGQAANDLPFSYTSDSGGGSRIPVSGLMVVEDFSFIPPDSTAADAQQLVYEYGLGGLLWMTVMYLTIAFLVLHHCVKEKR